MLNKAISSAAGITGATWYQSFVSQPLQLADRGFGIKELWVVLERNQKLSLAKSLILCQRIQTLEEERLTLLKVYSSGLWSPHREGIGSLCLHLFAKCGDVSPCCNQSDLHTLKSKKGRAVAKGECWSLVLEEKWIACNLKIKKKKSALYYFPTESTKRCHCEHFWTVRTICKLLLSANTWIMDEASCWWFLLRDTFIITIAFVLYSSHNSCLGLWKTDCYVTNLVFLSASSSVPFRDSYLGPRMFMFSSSPRIHYDNMIISTTWWTLVHTCEGQVEN